MAGTSKFEAGAQKGTFNHGHASVMGHAAAKRLGIAKALSGAPSPGMPGPADQAFPPADNAPPMLHPVAASHGFKAHVAHGAALKGVHVTQAHVHGAIDDMAGAGTFTPLQAAGLKSHTGPLIGDAGKATVGKIIGHLIARRGK